MTTARPALEWTDDNHAHENKAHYHAYEATGDTSEWKWRLEIYSMHTDVPGQLEERMGEFKHGTEADAKAFAQGLADQRGLTW